MHPIWGIWAGYILPWLIFSSIFSNILVILYNKYLSSINKLRIFYVTMAISNLTVTFVFHIESSFLGDGLSYISSGKFYYYLDHTDDFFCKGIRLFWGSVETFSHWIVFWFSFERYIVCSGKTINNNLKDSKCTCILLTLLILSVLLNIPAIFIWKIEKWPTAFDGAW